jgi:ferric-dicitrate binding protein FerR (iron transport regulator)
MQQESHLCERARSWASLRADGELSELESALLDAHLCRCPSCGAFARGTGEIAVALRAAALERPPAPVAIRALPARRTGLRALQVVAAVAVVVGAGVVAAVTGPAGRPAAAKPVAMVAGADSPDRLRELRRPALVQQGRTIPRNKQLPGDAV